MKSNRNVYTTNNNRRISNTHFNNNYNPVLCNRKKAWKQSTTISQLYGKKLILRRKVYDSRHVHYKRWCLFIFSSIY